MNEVEVNALPAIVTFKTCELSQVAQEAHGLGAVDVKMFLSLALKDERVEKVVF